MPLEQQLRGDTDEWATVWAPSLAIAARNLGLGNALSYLDEAIAGGFYQPGLFEPELGDAFRDLPQWTELLAAMEANTPEPPIEILTWPSIRPTAMELYRLGPAGEERLRTRIPAPLDSCWETAKALLIWATNAWEHSSWDHVQNDDANEVLDRVQAGERFACVEYSIVLSQALNALGIPSRRGSLRIKTYHAGFGAGHVVSEAWIEDLSKWVLLDGQNGLYWTSSDGTPLGIVELQQLHRNGGTAEAVCLRRPFTPDELTMWWTYFDTAHVTGAEWSPRPVSALFEGKPHKRPILAADPADVYPSLHEIAISIDIADGKPAILAHPAHPFAIGYTVTNGESTMDYSLGEVWPFPENRAPGVHETHFATRTRYGTTKPVTMTWRSR